MRKRRTPSLIALVAALVALAAHTAPVAASPAERPSAAAAPTYTVWATREGLVGKRTANGRVIQPRDRFVALPSWKVLAADGSYEFQVRVTYKNRSVVLPVWDVGPWNTHDDYWSPNRERYSDLPLGTPMAQAAVLQGYNGGLDEFGRVIQDPNGIDIADGAFWDDLGMTRTDKVQVTFLWMGADPGPPAGASEPPATGRSQPRPSGPAAPANPRPRAPAPPAQPTPPPGPEAPAPPIPEGALPVDNSDGGYSASQAEWLTGNCGVNDKHAWTYSTSDPAQGRNSASWTPSLPGPGFYEVVAYIPPCGTVQASNSARYNIAHDGGSSEVTLDQQAKAGSWASLGTFRFGGGTDQKVTLSDVAGDNRRGLRFDAVAWIPRTDSEPPDARVSAITRQNNGYLIEWSGTDAMSGIASYDVQVRQLPNGIWRDWQTAVTETSAWFGPDEGRHFAFRVRARDQAGNEQQWPPDAQMTTEQAAQPVP